MKYIGAHVSTAGGVDRAPVNAREIGATAFGMFLKNQRRWQAKPFDPETIVQFQKNCTDASLRRDMALPHDSYLINLGHPDPEPRERARAAFCDEMRRCEQLGLSLLNFHPGNHLNRSTVDECLAVIAESVNTALAGTKGITAVIENTAGQGSSVGFAFDHLARIIELIDDRERIGVCLDTCHCFSAGYDLRTRDAFESTMNEFEKIVGLEFLRGMHLNDSKRELGSRVDRHESLGRGLLGVEPFRMILQDERFDDMPLILETPDSERWPEEIAMLRSFAGDG